MPRAWCAWARRPRRCTCLLYTSYIDQTGCTAVFIRKLDGAFKEQYGHLFSDGLAGDWQLYRIEKDEGGMTFVPVPEGGKIV